MGSEVCFRHVVPPSTSNVGNPEGFNERLSHEFNMTILESSIASELDVFDPYPPPASPPGEVLPPDFVRACQPGKYGVPGQDICAICPIGAYCPSSVIIPCPQGTWTNRTGNQNAADCLLCPRDHDCLAPLGPKSRIENLACSADANSISCITGEEVVINRGYFVASPYHTKAFECVNRDSCCGGRFDPNVVAALPGCENRATTPLPAFGDATCRAGHTGRLCGTCLPRYYRAERECKACDAAQARSEELAIPANVAMAVVIPIGAICSILTVLIYLKIWNFSTTCVSSNRLMSRYLTSVVRWVRHHLDDRHVTFASGFFKIILSFCQCLGSLGKFNRIRWPDNFDSFIELVNNLNVKLFTFIPAECIKQNRLGFEFEILAILALPIVYLAGTYTVVFCSQIQQHGRTGVRMVVKHTWNLVNSSRAYKLIIFLMLVTCAAFRLERHATVGHDPMLTASVHLV